MIVGIGVDLVVISRVERLWLGHGERFARRILHPDELRRLPAVHAPGGYLAKGFAAREALVKALGSGLSGGVVMRDIEVVHDAAGRPGLRLYGPCASLAASRGVDNIHLSIADEQGLVTAFVILESASR